MASKDANRRSWGDTFAVYFQLPVFIVFLLGIASGFPFLLTGSTLAARLKETGVNIQTIGIFALVGLPYTFKFLAAPLVDSIKVKIAQSHLGQRKFWGVLSQILLVISLLCMAVCNPAENIIVMGVLAFMTAAFSAVQDIVIDALRVELVKKDTQGAAAAMSVAGYRVGMLLAGAGAFVLATFMPWSTVYAVGAAVMAACTLVTISIRELQGYDEAVNAGEIEVQNSQKNAEDASDTDKNPLHAFISWLCRAAVAPIADFLKRPAAWMTLMFILLYKLGDAMAGTLSVPFYLDMDYTKVEIAAISKVMGVAATIAGTFIAGFMVKRLPIVKTLFICGILQILSNFMYVWLANSAHNVSVLTVCIVIENAAGGMGTAAFVAFISRLCNVQFTATQYALLSSLSSVGRTLISSSAGFMVENLGWSNFFLITVALGIPGIVLLRFVAPALPSEKSTPANDAVS